MGQQYLIGPGVDIVDWNIAAAIDGPHKCVGLIHVKLKSIKTVYPQKKGAGRGGGR
jgi:hypothetical protein